MIKVLVAVNLVCFAVLEMHPSVASPFLCFKAMSDDRVVCIAPCESHEGLQSTRPGQVATLINMLQACVTVSEGCCVCYSRAQ